MAKFKTYSIANDTLNGILNDAALDSEMRADATVKDVFDGVSRDQSSGDFDVFLIVEIDATLEAALDAVVAAHTGDPLVSTQAVTIVDFDANIDPVPVDISNVTVTPECATMSNDFKIEYSGTNITMPSSYATIYSYSGSGKFYGFALDFNSDSVRVKLEVDGNEVFALTLDEVEGIQAFSSSGCDDNSGTASGLCDMLKKASGNRLYFTPKCPIAYSTTVTISGQRSGSSNKTLDKQMVFLEKTT